MDFIRRQPLWLLLSISSGTCAAINGVFAKLTTTSLTTTLASQLSTFLRLSASNTFINVLLRAAFFGLNLLFNLAMWTLFTAALTRASSATRVSIVNVSVNFMVTALAGWAVFGELLKGWWWLGAALLVVGNVVIGMGRDDEDVGKKKTRDVVGAGLGQAEGERLLGGERGRQEEEEDGDVIDLGEELVRTGDGSKEEEPDEEDHPAPKR
ncbi:MAG: hypothetical protein Q9160_003457 [Pyrenula sp. 1 TL-2023]